MLNKLKKIIKSKFLPDTLFIVEGDKSNKNIYLTFDDGPHPTVTEKLLMLLDKYDSKATFFVVGKNVKEHPELLKKIYLNGHCIANHSYSHPRFDLLSLQEQIVEIDETNKAITDTTKINCSMFRAPQGRWDFKVLWYMFRQKITAIHWSRDSMDYKKLDAKVIIDDFKTNGVNSGEIILFHDDDTLCLEVLDTLIPFWQSQGFNIKALKPVQ